MEDSIAPALSAEEWAFRSGITLGVHGSLPRMIALANAALPDDSPYKITRGDVDALRLESGPSEAFLFRLAAKLAALLPPGTP